MNPEYTLSMKKLDGILLLGFVLVMMGCFGFILWQSNYEYLTQSLSSEELRECMDIATEYELSGNLELRELLRISLHDGKLTKPEYKYFMRRKEEITTKKCVEYFNDGTYKYMDENIGRNFPQGYLGDKK